MARPYRLRVTRIVGTYVVLALLWIIASDYVADYILRTPVVHPYKGAAFVLATGALLFVVLSRAAASLRLFEEDLTATRGQFRQVVELAPEGIFITAAGEFRYVNPAFLRLVGAASEQDLLGKPALERVHPNDRAGVAARIASIYEGHSRLEVVERRYLRMDGEVLDVEISASPFDFLGEKAALVFVRDVSERTRSARQQEQLEAQVRQAQKMESIGRLAGGVAHDFNNLLTVINGYSDLLLTEWPENHPYWGTVQEIRDAGARAAGLTRQLLAFSRKDEWHAEVVDVNGLVRETERMLRRLVGEHIQVHTRLDESIGKVLADPSSLHQVLMNLVVNSRDAMPEGGSITIATANEEITESSSTAEPGAPRGPYVRLTVSDTGFGMDSAVQSHIFEPFFTTKGSGQGTGLGLSTAYGIVRNAGGWIRVESAPGAGTAMHVWLPVRDGTAPADPAHAAGVVPGGTETILLVEDDDAVRLATASILRGFGYTVIPAASGAQAIAMMESDVLALDLVISDVVMPDMPGPQFVETIRRTHPDLKALLISGYRAEEMQGAGMRSQELPFLAKPFTRTALAQRVRSILDRRGSISD